MYTGKIFVFLIILFSITSIVCGVSYFLGFGDIDYIPTVGGGMKEETFSIYAGLAYYWVGGMGLGVQAGYRMMDLFDINIAEGRGSWNVDLGVGINGTVLTFFTPFEVPFYASMGAGLGIFHDFRIDQLKLHSMAMFGVEFSTFSLFGWGFGGFGIGPTFSSYFGFEF